MRVCLIGSLIALLTIGCADQEEVDELGRQVMEQDTAPVVATAVEEAMTDTSAVGADAAAIPEEPHTVSGAPAGAGFTVQVASCESYDYAQHLLDLYRRRGYEPYAVQFDYDGLVYYRVRIGVLETAHEAAELKAELIDKYSIDAWVDRKEY